MTRLLIVTTVHNTLQGFLLPYAKHFRSKGWQVDGLARGATSSELCLEAFDHCYEASWSRNPLDPNGLFAMPGRIRNLVEEGGYDLVHVHTPIAALVTRFALRKMRRSGKPKVLYTAHGFHFHDGRGALGNAAFAAMERLGGRWTDRLIVINRTDEQEALRRKVISRDRLVYMPGIGLDLNRYSAKAVSDAEIAKVRSELGLGPEDVLFLMIAEFNPGKRHRDLLEGFAHINNPRIHLAFAGFGVLEESLKAWCAEQGIADRVHFLGYRRDIPTLIRASRATVLPSEREGLPRSVMESMALGVPVIGSSARGVRDMIQSCGGIMTPVGDAGALRDALMKLAEDPAEARRMGEDAHARMAPFHIDHLMEMHEALYAELLKESR